MSNLEKSLDLAYTMAGLEASARDFNESLKKIDPILYGFEELQATLNKVNTELAEAQEGLTEALADNMSRHAEL